MHTHSCTYELHLKWNPWNSKDTGQGVATGDGDILCCACVEEFNERTLDLWVTQNLNKENKLCRYLWYGSLCVCPMGWGTWVVAWLELSLFLTSVLHKEKKSSNLYLDQYPIQRAFCQGWCIAGQALLLHFHTGSLKNLVTTAGYPNICTWPINSQSKAVWKSGQDNWWKNFENWRREWELPFLCLKSHCPWAKFMALKHLSGNTEWRQERRLISKLHNISLISLSWGFAVNMNLTDWQMGK